MRKKTDKPTALLHISGNEGASEASKAIREVLASSGQTPETLQEAMRTLAVIGKPPKHFTVSHCQFYGKGKK